MAKKLLYFVSCFILLANSSWAQELKSPDGNYSMNFFLQDGGIPSYSLFYKGKEVIKPSRLGLELKGKGVERSFDDFSGEKSSGKNLQTNELVAGFQITNTQTATFDEIWQPVWGEEKDIRNHYNELAITLNQESSNRQILIRFRLFDDGLGFRYEFPEQKNLIYFVI